MVTLDISAQFKGNGYLELDRNTVANSSNQLSSGIAVLFSTRQPNGLLLWYGQNKGQAFNGEDFLALSVNEGILEFAFRLDGEGLIFSTFRNDQNINFISRLQNHSSDITEFVSTRTSDTSPFSSAERTRPASSSTA